MHTRDAINGIWVAVNRVINWMTGFSTQNLQFSWLVGSGGNVQVGKTLTVIIDESLNAAFLATTPRATLWYCAHATFRQK